MTVMIPPVPLLSAPSSEKQVFKIIRDMPVSEDYYCLHSVGLARHHRKTYGEADFIIISPLGVFCLEVKGGHVVRKDGIWTIGWPGRSYESIEGPFKQAQETIFPLIDEISQRLGKNFKSKTMVGWGVVIPDQPFRDEDPEWSLNVVCDAGGKENFMAYLERLATHTKERESLHKRKYPKLLSPEECRELADCFRGDFNNISRIGDLIGVSQDEITELSKQQYTVLDHTLDPSNPRIKCTGAAGTGKTLIALEAARRLASEGLSVLFLCYNRLLGEHLKTKTIETDGTIHIWSLHQFMRNIIILSGYREDLVDRENRSNDDTELFGSIYPDLFETAGLKGVSDQIIELFDVLIIDEAQDVLYSPTIDVLGILLKQGLEGGRWLFLLDPDLQSEIYGKMDQRVITTIDNYCTANLSLKENFRNPETVVDQICRLTGITKPDCKRKIKSPVEYITYSSRAEQTRKLKSLIIKLLSEKVAASSITILSGSSRNDSSISSNPPEISKKLVWLDSKSINTVDSNCITACSVSAFKGMENEIIILTDLPSPTGTWEKSVAYVGMSRSLVKVYALVDGDFFKFENIGDL